MHCWKFSQTFQGLNNHNKNVYTNRSFYHPSNLSVLRNRTCSTMVNSFALRKDEKALVLYVLLLCSSIGCITLWSTIYTRRYQLSPSPGLVRLVSWSPLSAPPLWSESPWSWAVTRPSSCSGSSCSKDWFHVYTELNLHQKSLRQKYGHHERKSAELNTFFE